MRNFNDDEYIKIFRKMVFWEWYTDVKTTKLFLHCLIMANWKPGRWKGRPYKRGQFYTSLDSLSKETGLSVQEVRTALDKLKATNEITEQTTSVNRLITVVSFDKYQGEQQAEQQTKQQAKQQAKQQGSNKASTKHQQQNKNIKNIKKDKEIKEENPVPADAGPDGYGEVPEGWTDDDEEQFHMMYEDNNWKTRRAWAEYWKR